MNQQNLVILEGNACRDTEVKNTNPGVLIGKILIAVNRLYKSGEVFEKEASFLDVDCFGETAKLYGEKAKKGGRNPHYRPHEVKPLEAGRPESERSDIVITEHVEFSSKKDF
ncbi:MAG: single-stranded DNA-binding protein [Treponema sp.]|jgi:hypothetical protein|nr:single-stranded DNA-binding protein [Treponema sp.]